MADLDTIINSRFKYECDICGRERDVAWLKEDYRNRIVCKDTCSDIPHPEEIGELNQCADTLEIY